MTLPFRLYLISDRHRMGPDPLGLISELAHAGLPALQWREKDLAPAENLRWLRAIAAELQPPPSSPADQPAVSPSIEVAGPPRGDEAPQFPWQIGRVPASEPFAPVPPVVHAWQQTHVEEELVPPGAPSARADRTRPAVHLFINDRLDLALMARCHLHLTESSVPTECARELAPPGMWIGRSTHSIEGARAAARAGADFITFGPVYDTPSKREFGAPPGCAALREVCAELAIPVFALGGIGLDRIEECLEAGAYGIAMIRAVWDAPDPLHALGQILRSLPDPAPLER